MHRVTPAAWFAALLAAASLQPAGAAFISLTGTPIAQPGAAAHAVGCSLEETRRTAAENYRLNGSFLVDGPQPATAVRLAFVIDDELGDPHVVNGIATGSYAPGARIDGNSYAGRGPVRHFRSLRCYVAEAIFADGTKWRAVRPDLRGLPP